MSMRSSICARIACVHGSAPKMPMRSERRGRIQALAHEFLGDRQHVRGRHHDDVRPQSQISCTCLWVWPPDMGITVQPSRSAP